MSKCDRDASTTLDLTFNDQGLIPAITVDAASGEVLMLAYMNEQALAETQRTGFVHYWSRSRGELWRKGATSGHTQKLVSLQVDCDQDTLLVSVEQVGAACHTGRRSCFYRTLKDDGTLRFDA